MSHIVAASMQYPEHYFSQADIADAYVAYTGKEERAIRRMFKSVQVAGKHLSMPMSDYITKDRFEERNQVWQTVALDLAEKCCLNVLRKAAVAPEKIGQLIFTTVTGLSVPSIDAKIMNRIPFSPSMKRMPLFGLGCVAGAAGLSRAHDYLIGHPDECCILLSVELCSLTMQKDDLSLESIISSGLFGDGAAAVLLAGNKAKQSQRYPRIVDTCSAFFPDSEYVMGWDFRDSGFKIVLSSDVPKLAREKLPDVIKSLISKHGLSIADIDHWVCHPGGPKVIDAIEETLDLPTGELDITRNSLNTIGNLSSASVLSILKDTIDNKEPAKGSNVIIMAMGPGFCAEALLVKW